MKQWIRWPGLIGFIVVAGLLVAGWLFAAGPLMKMALESAGSKAVGAKVDIASVDLTLNPVGVVIQGVQVADAKSPMTNVVSIERAVADVAFVPLLLGKGIVEELSLSGVAFGTARSTSGALPVEAPSEEVAEEKAAAQASADETQEVASKKAEAESSALDNMAQALPSTDEVLAREPLKTVEHGKAFKQSYQTHRAEIDQAIANVPNAQALKQYETRLNAIINGRFESIEDFKQRKKEFDELNKQFKQDKAAVAAAKKAISVGKKELNEKWKLLKDAPESDYEQLKGKYSLDNQGIANLSGLLFGGESAQYALQALEIYEKIAPLLASDETAEEELAEEDKDPAVHGRYVHFKTDRPLPNLWIKKVAFTSTMDQGDIAVSVNNITDQQDVIAKPTTLVIRSASFGAAQNILLNGVMDRRQKQAVDRFDLQVDNYRVKKMDLGMAGLKLDSSQVAINAKGSITDGQLSLDGRAQFTQAKFSTKDRTLVAKELNNALTKIPSFDLNADANGPLRSPKVGFNSDLDEKLQAIFNQVIKDKQKAFEKELKAKLKEQMLAYAGDYQGLLKELGVADGDMSKLDKKITELSRKKMASFEDQKKREAQEAAKKKEAELKRKQKEKEEELKRQQKEKQKELEKQAKDKLKNLF